MKRRSGPPKKVDDGQRTSVYLGERHIQIAQRMGHRGSTSDGVRKALELAEQQDAQ